MKKLFKMGGVSVVAIMATMGANAAGYTCENSIVYESCNGGYYLTDSSRCPDGYRYFTGVCDDAESLYTGKSGCEPYVDGEEVQYWDELCIKWDDGMGGPSDDDTCEYGCSNVGYEIATPSSGAKTCADCPAGSYCPAGSDAPTACPAGSYCATAGLVSGVLCPLGTYSTGGATSCTTCPASGLTDKNGNSVTATTASTGASGLHQCIIPSGVEFKNDKGVFSFKSTCAFDFYITTTDGTCPSGYAYIDQSRINEEGGGSYYDTLGQEGCYKIPANVQDIETCGYMFENEFNSGYVYCDDDYNNVVTVQFQESTL